MTDMVKVFGCRPAEAEGRGEAGVRKPPMQEPAGGAEGLWRFEDLRHGCDQGGGVDQPLTARVEGRRPGVGAAAGTEQGGWQAPVTLIDKRDEALGRWWHAIARWPKRGGFDGRVEQVGPGHDAIIPDATGEAGGPLGWAALWPASSRR